MSLFTDASLVMIPSGVKDGKLYSIKPDDGVGDFTFTRGSNLAATRVDENGLIEKGRENLFLNSDAPVTQSITISNGTVYTLSFKGTGSIVAIGGGSFALNGTGATDLVQQYFVSSSTTITLTLSGTITEPQLELGLVATDYIETGATTEQAGILENLPRLDYTDSSCPSLLLEPTRSNLVTHSEYFASSDWSDFIYSGASINKTFGYASPENKNNAYKWDIVTGTGGVLVTDNITVTASVDYSLSVWMKGEVGGEKVRLDFKDTSSAGVNGPLFTLTTEWVRYEVSVTNSAGTSRGFQFRMLQSEGVGSQTIYVYGAQLEAGSYPTSYIPTYGTSVTRSGDVCVGAGDATTFNDNEGVLFVEFGALTDDNNGSKSISISSGAYSNNIIIQYTTNTNQIAFKTSPSYTTPIFQSYNVSDITENSKIAFKYKLNDCSFWHNGSKLGSVTSFTPFSSGTLTQLNFNRGDGSEIYEGNVKSIIYFPTALTDSELAALTTI